MELLKQLTGWVGKARMTVSGTEATMHAMRVARAYTGRNKIVKFEGQYHGVHDYALVSVTPNDMAELGSEDNPVGLAWGRGIPEAVTQHDHPGALQRDRRSSAASSSATVPTSPRSSSSRCSATRRGSCPGRASTRRCGRSPASSERSSSSTRSRPASASPAAGPPSTSA